MLVDGGVLIFSETQTKNVSLRIILGILVVMHIYDFKVMNSSLVLKEE